METKLNKLNRITTSTRYFFVLLGLLLSFNLYAQDLKTQSIEWIDKRTDFKKGIYPLTEVLIVEAKTVTTVNENREEKELPHVICKHQDMDIMMVHDKKRVLAVRFDPINIRGLEKIIIYVNHKGVNMLQTTDNAFYGVTYDGKYFIYNAKDFSLTLMPTTNEEVMGIMDNYFK